MTDDFATFGVSAPIVDALTERGIEAPFPIQAAVIEASLDGRDVAGKAPTGSGKTLAFGIPAAQLAESGSAWTPDVLVLSPTRELATQIKDELEPLAKASGRSIATVFGGTNIQRDINRLERGVDILVACPGRLEDLISRRCCELRRVRIAIVDEADRLADMGFLPAVKRILDQTRDDRQTLLFSATLDGEVDTLMERYQNDPLIVEVEGLETDEPEIEHQWFTVGSHNRIDQAVDLLNTAYSAIVFCRTRRGCDRVAKQLQKRGLAAVAIHGDRSQAQRQRALASFTSGEAHVLVATDVAARGIHVDDVDLVLHYDPAGTDKDYIHRSGRTGRAGKTGRVVSLVPQDKEKVARKLQADLGQPRGFAEFEEAELPEAIDHRPPPKPEARAENDRGTGKGRPKNKSNQQRNPRKSRDARGRDGDHRGGRDRKGHDGRDRDRNRNDRGRSRNNRNRDWNDRDDRNGNDNRGGNNRGRNRNNRNRDWDDRGGNDNRSGNDRGRNRNNRNRDWDDRGGNDNRSGNNRGRNRNNRNRDDWDDRGGNDRGRSRSDRSGPGRGRGRGGESNDWYPPGWDHDRDTRKARNRQDRRDDERDEIERPTSGGRNTTQRKPRADKGRHKDRNAGRNKGKRRKPSNRKGNKRR